MLKEQPGGDMAASSAAPSGRDRPVRLLSLPAEGETERIPFSPNQDMKLTFDQAASSFDRSGADLVISSDKTGTLILTDFCRPEHAGHLPRLILLSGDIIAGEDLVTVLDPESLPPPSAGPGFALGQLTLDELFQEAESGAGAGPHAVQQGQSLADLSFDFRQAGSEELSLEMFLIKHGLG